MDDLDRERRYSSVTQDDRMDEGGARSRSRSPHENRRRSESPHRSPRRSLEKDSRYSDRQSDRRSRRDHSNSPERRDSRGDSRNMLYVSGLSKRTREADLEKKFARCGKVIRAQVMVDPHTHESRQFAFVEMETSDDADRAMTKLNRTELDGRTMVVERARRARPRTPTPGKYNGPSKATHHHSRSRDPYHRSTRSPSRSGYSDRDRYDRSYGDSRYDAPPPQFIDDRYLFAAAAARYAAMASTSRPVHDMRRSDDLLYPRLAPVDPYLGLPPPRRDRSRSPFRHR